MSDYKSLYYELFNQVSDVITMLKTAQQECESMFIDGAEGDASRPDRQVEMKGKGAE